MPLAVQHCIYVIVLYIMTLNGVMAVILRYFTDFGSFGGQRKLELCHIARPSQQQLSSCYKLLQILPVKINSSELVETDFSSSRVNEAYNLFSHPWGFGVLVLLVFVAVFRCVVANVKSLLCEQVQYSSD